MHPSFSQLNNFEHLHYPSTFPGARGMTSEKNPNPIGSYSDERRDRQYLIKYKNGKPNYFR